jgi:two-component system, OmpR family, KDP operon response regulator KdpE
MTELRPAILLIEDEPPLKKFLRITMQTQSYKVIEASTGQEGLKLAATEQPDVILLDLGLPDMDGIEIIKSVRGWSPTVPIIVVSARGKEQEKVVALDAGADDYISKPFSVGELLARLRVIFRRLAAFRPDSVDPVFELDGLRVDLLQRQVSVGGESIHLTATEFKLLSVLVKNAGRVVTHQQLLKEVWGPGSVNESHYVRVYVNQLRQKLELDTTRPKYILSEPGIGYRLCAQS